MNRSLRALSLFAALGASLAALPSHAEVASRLNGTPAQAAERSADEAMYDARYGMLRSDAGQGTLERSGATGGGGQHG